MLCCVHLPCPLLLQLKEKLLQQSESGGECSFEDASKKCTVSPVVRERPTYKLTVARERPAPGGSPILGE